MTRVTFPPVSSLMLPTLQPLRVFAVLLFQSCDCDPVLIPESSLKSTFKVMKSQGLTIG